MRYALVCDGCGHVINSYDDPDQVNWMPPEGHSLIQDDPPMAGPGWTWDGQKFNPPPPGQAAPTWDMGE